MSMKKLMLIAVLTCALVLGIVATVSADNGPHGSFTATTDACANCHRAHSAAYGSNGLLVNNAEALCLSCHDGTGASTNVEGGVYTGRDFDRPERRGRHRRRFVVWRRLPDRLDGHRLERRHNSQSGLQRHLAPGHIYPLAGRPGYCLRFRRS